MKLIIIIQSLIIIGGAYYVYLLGQTKEVVTVPTPVDVPVFEPNKPRDGYVPPTENPPADPAVLNSEITGSSDVGMEFPIPDEEIQVR